MIQTILLQDLFRDYPEVVKHLDAQAEKWGREIPFGTERRMIESLLDLSDEQLEEEWKKARSNAIPAWVKPLYWEWARDKRILDLGCGGAFTSITLSFGLLRDGLLICADLSDKTLCLVERIAKLKDIPVGRRRIKPPLDAIFCFGSLICSPADIVKLECAELMKYLPIGGRWIELAYPKSRWEREGSLPFTEWGKHTDGGAPWMQYRELDDVLDSLAPARFETILNFSFHNGDFNWFDLLRVG